MKNKYYVAGIKNIRKPHIRNSTLSFNLPIKRPMFSEAKHEERSKIDSKSTMSNKVASELSKTAGQIAYKEMA